MEPSAVSVFGVIVGVAAAGIAAGPGIRTAITHRRSDNGIAFGILAVGVVIWAVAGVCQLVAQEAIVRTYFLVLSLIGASATALGWFLFASTARSTPERLSRRSIYAGVTLVVGLNIGLIVTIPIHDLYWSGVTGASMEATRSVVETGYWVHTLLVAGLCLTGSWLFAKVQGNRQDRIHGLAYAICGITVTVTILMSNSTTPGSGMLSPILAAGLVCLGIVQATRL